MNDTADGVRLCSQALVSYRVVLKTARQANHIRGFVEHLPKRLREITDFLKAVWNLPAHSKRRAFLRVVQECASVLVGHSDEWERLVSRKSEVFSSYLYIRYRIRLMLSSSALQVAFVVVLSYENDTRSPAAGGEFYCTRPGPRCDRTTRRGIGSVVPCMAHIGTHVHGPKRVRVCRTSSDKLD